MKIFMAAISFGIAFTAHSEESIGKFFPIQKLSDSVSEEMSPLFLLKTKSTAIADGKEDQDSVITDHDGKILLKEHAVYAGAKLASQEIEQMQTGESFKLVVANDEASFTAYKIKNGERKIEFNKKEKIDGPLVTGPVVREFLREHWTELNEGKSLKVRFAVMERGETVGFTFRKLPTSTEKDIVVELHPSNFFIKMMVDPIELTFNSKNKDLIRYKGRTPLKKMIEGKWTPIDSDIAYSQKVGVNP